MSNAAIFMLVLIVFAWGIVSATRFIWRFVIFPLWIVFNTMLLQWVALFHDSDPAPFWTCVKCWGRMYRWAVIDPEDIPKRWEIKFPDGHEIDWLVRL